MLSARKAEFDKIAGECGISAVLARLIRNRGIIGTEETRSFLACDASLCHDPFLLPEMDQAVRILRQKIAEGAVIRIIGDYDADGICASRILLLGFRGLGARADAVLPERMTDGYGINRRLVDDAREHGADVIVTCDNGIAALDALSYAETLGLTAVVTDHHEPPVGPDGITQERVPAAAVVDPKFGDAYPFREICGAVVALKLMEALCGPDGIRRADHEEMLGLAAIATVCDVMPLTDENRYYVRKGLSLLPSAGSEGIRALIAQSGLSGERITAYHAGFILGPCLNASGRMDSALRALSLLDEADPEKAMHTAAELRALNESRKSMTVRNVEAAGTIAQEKIRQGRKILVLYLPDCHEALAGIVAGRIRETYDRPVFVLTDSTEEGMLKGSGRSVEAYDMFSGLNAAREYLEKFGGHKMAAGLTLRASALAGFEEAVNDRCPVAAADMEEILHIDMELPPGLFTTGMVGEFEKMEPFGTGNPRPLFVSRNIQVYGLRVMGRSGSVVQLDAADQDRRRFRFIWFGEQDRLRRQLDLSLGEGTFAALSEGVPAGIRMHAVFTPQLHTYRGVTDIQFVLKDMKKA